MTITLYNVSKYVPDLLDNFPITQDASDYMRWINLKVFDVHTMVHDGQKLKLTTQDVRTGKWQTAWIDSRLFTYFDVV